MKIESITLDGKSLTIEEVIRLACGQPGQPIVVISDAGQQQVERAGKQGKAKQLHQEDRVDHERRNKQQGKCDTVSNFRIHFMHLTQFCQTGLQGAEPARWPLQGRSRWQRLRARTPWSALRRRPWQARSQPLQRSIPCRQSQQPQTPQ